MTDYDKSQLLEVIEEARRIATMLQPIAPVLALTARNLAVSAELRLRAARMAEVSR